MTRVLHTADVHLDPDHPERLGALRAVLERAEATDVDAVTVGGDLFDAPAAVEQFRPQLRNDLFTDRPFAVVVIPGNHDVAAFRGDVFFGDACTVVTEEPFGHWLAPDGDLRITALPYRERVDDDLLLALQDREPFDGTEALLLHCSLDAPFADAGTGDEGAGRYFPVTEGLLVELGFDHYLAGHYHGAHRVSLPDGATFAYPGTPASTRSSETGRRRVCLLDTDDGVAFEPLDTFHHVHRAFTATPGDEAALFEAVREWVAATVTTRADAAVRVDGFVEMDEAAFNEALVEAAGDASVTDGTRSVSHVHSHPLYRAFEDELADADWDDETKRRVAERTLDVFCELTAGGEL